MSVTVPDQALMAEAADTITELRAKVASLEKSLKETQQKLEREQGLNEMAADNAREQFDEDRAGYEEKIEFLEADRLRLANLIHPDTPGCDVVAGRCHLCTEAIKRRDEGVRVLCDAVERMINDLLLTEGEAEASTEALEKVRRELE